MVAQSKEARKQASKDRTPPLRRRRVTVARGRRDERAASAAAPFRGRTRSGGGGGSARSETAAPRRSRNAVAPPAPFPPETCARWRGGRTRDAIYNSEEPPLQISERNDDRHTPPAGRRDTRAASRPVDVSTCRHTRWMACHGRRWAAFTTNETSDFATAASTAFTRHTATHIYIII